jgi:formylglycine-generating enzyme required for sulfatase activity
MPQRRGRFAAGLLFLILLVGCDADGDGYWGPPGPDCNDAVPEINPGADEGCDGVDSNCDGLLGLAEVDQDLDGYTACEGDCFDVAMPGGEVAAQSFPGAPEICDGRDNDCDGVVPVDEIDADGDGVRTCSGDCDDAQATVFPGATEACDGLDNDCDGLVPADESDADADAVLVCGGDCDDTNPDIFAGAPDVCDGMDNDCDLQVDEDSPDNDVDGFSLCDGDCDDADLTTHPGAEELCDGLDNDCDGLVPADEADADGDGQRGCAGDCADGDPDNFTGNAEVCDGEDNDCDAEVDEGYDLDGDGVLACDGDCDDSNPSIHPAATELCGNGLDDDCDVGTPDTWDGDGDGADCAMDCDDADAALFPGNPEVCDGLDNDCAGGIPADEADADGDGVRLCAGDCDDTNPAVEPGADEVCDNGADDDCDPSTADLLDLDGDGLLCDEDCDDDDPALPSAEDTNCDGNPDVVGDLVWIAGGVFDMGCTPGQSSCGGEELPVVGIELTRDFWLGQTEVTQAQWFAVFGNSPSTHTGCDACPVEGINFYEALAWTNALSDEAGLTPCYVLSACNDGETTPGAWPPLECSSYAVNTTSGSPYDCEGYRLPTEAEWEYAARAGTDWLYAGSNEDALHPLDQVAIDEVAWYDANSSGTTASAQLLPNEWGLYDMSGNTWEWVWDSYDFGWYATVAANSGAETDPAGPPVGSLHTYRGGAYSTVTSYCRVSRRAYGAPTFDNFNLGFRVAKTDCSDPADCPP